MLSYFICHLTSWLGFLTNKFGRCFRIRNDYGLEEYTVYLYKNS